MPLHIVVEDYDDADDDENDDGNSVENDEDTNESIESIDNDSNDGVAESDTFIFYYFEGEDLNLVLDGSGADGNDNTDSYVLIDLTWRVVKFKSEEEKTNRFLRSKPRYLPYSACRKLVSAWTRWLSETECYVTSLPY